jgi:hypothetical protein
MRGTPPTVGAAVAALAVAVSGCGDGSSPIVAANPLQWTAAPQVFRTTALPDDRVAVGSVRNTTDAPLELDATALAVVDANGRRLRSTGQYAAGYAHGLYGAFQKPDPLPPGELTRLGLRVTIAPGKTAPLAVSWTVRKGSEPARAASVDYGPGRLTLPTTVRQAAGGP